MGGNPIRQDANHITGSESWVGVRQRHLLSVDSQALGTVIQHRNLNLFRQADAVRDAEGSMWVYRNGEISHTAAVSKSSS